MLARTARAYGIRNRRRKLAHLLRLMGRVGAERVLLVGVSANSTDYDNLIEREIADRMPRTVALGLAASGPEWVDYRQGDGLNLPFKDGEFDIVFSNAVIEHVGDEAAQRRFVAEHNRVGRAWMLTTPNRAFPVEAHDRTLFTHWLPGWEGRSGTVTRLVTYRSLRDLIPDHARLLGTWASPTLIAYSPPATQGTNRKPQSEDPVS